MIIILIIISILLIITIKRRTITKVNNRKSQTEGVYGWKEVGCSQVFRFAGWYVGSHQSQQSGVGGGYSGSKNCKNWPSWLFRLFFRPLMCSRRLWIIHVTSLGRQVQPVFISHRLFKYVGEKEKSKRGLTVEVRAFHLMLECERLMMTDKTTVFFFFFLSEIDGTQQRLGIHLFVFFTVPHPFLLRFSPHWTIWAVGRIGS